MPGVTFPAGRSRRCGRPVLQAAAVEGPRLCLGRVHTALAGERLPVAVALELCSYVIVIGVRGVFLVCSRVCPLLTLCCFLGLLFFANGVRFLSCHLPCPRSRHPQLGIKITTSLEDEPMGTAGPLKVAEKHLNDGEPFFVLNSDVTCDFPFQAMIDFHKKTGAEGTLLVTKVTDPSKFGVILYDDAGKISQFVEKPQDFVGDRINAGIYLLSPGVFDRIELRPTSIEKEVFPIMAKESKLFCMELPGFWADVGQPADFRSGTALNLASLRESAPDTLASGEPFEGNVMVAPDAVIGKGCRIGPDVVVGPGCVVGDGVRLVRSTLLGGSRIGGNSYVADSIVGWSSKIGEWARLCNGCVLGEDVSIKSEVCASGATVLPHKSVGADIMSPKIVL